jgi:hypothetical protein
MSSKKRSLSPPPGNAGKTALSSIFDSPPPPPIRRIRAGRGGGDATALSKVQGIVVRAKDEVVAGPKGPIPKRRIDLVVTGIIVNGAQDVVRTGVEGESYLFPTRVVDNGVEGETGGFKSKSRALIVSPNQVVRKLSTFSSSFYKDSKEGGETGVVACDVGSTVEVSGVAVNAVTKNGATNFYLNGGKVTPLTDSPPSPAVLPQNMIMLASQPKLQEWSAFSASIPAKGFFNTSELNEAQIIQANACQALWQRLVDGAADRLAVMSQCKDEETARILEGHEARIRATPPEKVASGDTSLFLVDKFDSTIAPIVQLGLTPSNRVPEVIQKLQAGGEEAFKLPQTFTAPWVVHVETAGKSLNVDLRVAYVFDKEAALEALDKGLQPTLVTQSAGIAMSLSLRDFAVKFGTLLEEKVVMACKQLLPIADFAAFPKVSNLEEGGGTETIKTDFPEGGTLYVDMSATLKKCSIPVSESFIKANLCGGGAQFVPPKVAKEVAKLEFPEKVTEMPDLEEYKYQEITYDSFDISNWADLGTVQYRVVVPDVCDIIKANPELVSDPAKGEKFLHNLREDLKSAHKMKSFLTQECLVYALLA